MSAIFFGWDWPIAWLQVLDEYRPLEGSVNGRGLVSFLGVFEQLIGPGQPVALGLGISLSLGLFIFLCSRFLRIRRREELPATWGRGHGFVDPDFAAHPVLRSRACWPYPRCCWRIGGAWGPRSHCWGCGSFPGCMRSGKPVVQPLFFLAIAGFLGSLRLWRSNHASEFITDSSLP